MDEWREIVDYPGYEVSNQGQVRSWRQRNQWGVQIRRVPLVLKRAYTIGGYPFVSLCNSSGIETKPIHRIVLEAFIGPCPDGFQTCHNNGIRKDCRLTNLRWDTCKSNNADKIRHGTSNRGSRHGMSKLTEEQVLRIRGDNRPRRVIAEDYDVSTGTIYGIKSHTSWSWLHSTIK